MKNKGFIYPQKNCFLGTKHKVFDGFGCPRLVVFLLSKLLCVFVGFSRFSTVLGVFFGMRFQTRCCSFEVFPPGVHPSTERV